MAMSVQLNRGGVPSSSTASLPRHAIAVTATGSRLVPSCASLFQPLRSASWLQAVAKEVFTLEGSEVKSAEQLLEEPAPRIRLSTAEECPFCADAPIKENGKRCVGVCRNLQNVPGPQLFPHEMQTAEDAVRLQLNAVRDNHVPRFNHGVQVLYEFCVEAGRMERSRYFGYSSDLYHFDHFMGKSLSTFADLFGNRSYEILPGELMPDGRTRVRAVVENLVGQKIEWSFIMVKRTFGKYEGCWNTHRLVRSDSKHMGEI